MRRTLGIVVAIAVVAGFAVASQARVIDGHRPADVKLTYKKWIPSYPGMTGVVAGDIPGQFVGAALEVTPNARGYLVDAVYIDVATDPSRSFTARVQGTEDTAAAAAARDSQAMP